MRQCLLCVSVVLCLAAACAAQTFDVYFIDVEGGQATLMVSPSGKSMLVDTGWSGFQGRDAERIVAAAKSAGLKRIDYLVITHYHRDHVGGVSELAEKIPIKVFVDHGAGVDTTPAGWDLLAAYQKVRANGRHVIVKPGGRIRVKGLDVRVLSTAGKLITAPLPGAGSPNPLCAEAQRVNDDPGENGQSIGIMIRYRKFRLLDLGDLSWNRELDLACPNHLLGTVDAYLTTHHASETSGPAAMVYGLQPRVAIMNNGARKGGAPDVWRTLRKSPGLEDIWQLHYSVEGGESNNAPPEFIANLEEDCKGYGLKLSVGADGSFTVTNARNGLSKNYPSR